MEYIKVKWQKKSKNLVDVQLQNVELEFDWVNTNIVFSPNDDEVKISMVNGNINKNPLIYRWRFNEQIIYVGESSNMKSLVDQYKTLHPSRKTRYRVIPYLYSLIKKDKSKLILERLEIKSYNNKEVKDNCILDDVQDRRNIEKLFTQLYSPALNLE